MLRLAPEGWPFVTTTLVLAVLAQAGSLLAPPTSPGLEKALQASAALLGILTLFMAFFFRNPVRQRRDAEGLVLAPGDGKITQITPVEEPSFFTEPVTRISIFLSIFDVHVQRAPVTGRVALKSYEEGGFALAWKSEASEENEQATLGFTAGPHRVMVRQIAGMVARRIVTDPEEGDLVPQGSRIGIIRFGSRVDLFLPQEWELTCRVGDRARGGLTALARIPETKRG